jgi:excisionase family DNA binding protein
MLPVSFFLLGIAFSLTTIKIASTGVEKGDRMVTPIIRVFSFSVVLADPYLCESEMAMSSMMMNSEKPDDDGSVYVTVGEAARYLGVGRRIVYQLIDFGRIRADRRRKMIRVDPRSLEEFRRSGRLT